MVAITNVFFGLSAAAVALAAPAIEKRGPQNFSLGPDSPLARRHNSTLDARSNTNYVQNYHTGGTVNFSSKTNGFSLNWNVQQDFVVGVGWQPGSSAPIKYSGSFNPTSGEASLSVYGWSTNPLVEYYVMENNHNIGTGAFGTVKGTFTSDGGTYTIYEHTQVNQPSIQGTSTFNQYISVRQSPRTSGTVTIANHFNAWKSHGMNLGSLNYQVVAVESWSGSGNAQQTVTN